MRGHCHFRNKRPTVKVVEAGQVTGGKTVPVNTNSLNGADDRI
jgi:hypothetical protein